VIRIGVNVLGGQKKQNEMTSLDLTIICDIQGHNVFAFVCDFLWLSIVQVIAI
jgi:hypothetical protein